jgi:hypothetical protein
MVADRYPTVMAVALLAIGLNYLLSPGLASAVAVLGILLALLQTNWALPADSLRFGWPLLGIIFLGLIAGTSHPFRGILKDGWYFALPLIGMLHGILLSYLIRDGWRVAFFLIVAGGLASVVFVLQWILTVVSGVLIEGVEGLRSVIGGGFGISALACVVAVFWYREIVRRVSVTQRILVTLMTAVSFAAVALSFSRTMILGVLLGLLIRTLFNRGWFLGVVVFLALIIGAGAMLAQVAMLGDGLVGSLMLKVTRSLVELFPQDAQSQTDLNLNWRGFESLMGLKAFLSGSDLQRIMGQGFGATVDLGLVMQLGGRDFDRIPVLHNGYVYLLVKTGFSGFALYLLWLVLLGIRAVRSAVRSDLANALAGRVLLSAVVYTAAATLVVTGAFNKLDGYPLTLVMGCMLYCSRPGFPIERVRI